MKQIHSVTLLGLAACLSTLWAPAVAPAATFKVFPGASIQAAIDNAGPGDTIRVMPGDYTEPALTGPAVRITKPLKLVGHSNLKKNIRVRILAGPGQSDGIVVEPANPSDPDVVGIKVQGFTVEGFPDNGIWLKHVQKFTIKGNESVNNLENGIWPTLSANGNVKKNVSYGSLDSALWVEASEDVRVIQNELYNSPTGLEVTISKNVKISRNDIHDNTVGVGLYHPNGAGIPAPPGLLAGGGWVISKNRIYNNNLPNAAPPGSIVSLLPSGLGVLILGVDGVIVEKNEIYDNDFLGVGAVDWCIAVGNCGTNPPLIQPAPDNNRIEGNLMGNNGTAPPMHPFDFLASDMAMVAFPNAPWSPIGGKNNCFKDNLPFPPALGITSNFSLTPNQC